MHCPQACTRAHVCPTCASHPPVLLPPLQYETKGTITSEESDKRESCLQSYPVALSCPALIHQLTCCIISARKKCSCESNCCAAEHTPPSSLLVHPVRLPCSGGPEHTLCLRLRQHLRLGEQPPPICPRGNNRQPQPSLAKPHAPQATAAPCCASLCTQPPAVSSCNPNHHPSHRDTPVAPILPRQRARCSHAHISS